MEFLTKQQKKKKAQRLYFGYLLLSVLVLLATYVLISTALGFEVFSSKGQVVQNGLLFVNSRPDNAEIYINGKKESNNTNSKFTVPESAYSIQLKKAGYRDWYGDVSLVGGTVEFLTYPRLMPTSPKLLSSSVVASSPVNSQSLNRRWVASYIATTPNAITVRDLDNPTDPSVTISIPVSITGDKVVSALRFVAWAGDNEHFMAAVSLAGTPSQQFVIFHRQKQDEIVNISSMYSLSAGDDVGFWDAKKDKIYIKQTNGTVLSGNVKDKSLAAQPLFTDLAIEIFPISKERAIYTTKVGDETVVKYLVDNKTYSISTLKDPTKKVIAKSFGFNRNEYILLAGEGFEKTLIYKNFENAVTESSTGRVAPFFTMPAQSKVADVSRSNRFVMGYDDNEVQVYDIEQKDYFRYELPTSRPAEIGWFDDARLYSLGSDRRLNVFDFTGRNVYEIASVTVGKPIVNEDVSKLSMTIQEADVYVSKIVDIESATE